MSYLQYGVTKPRRLFLKVSQSAGNMKPYQCITCIHQIILKYAFSLAKNKQSRFFFVSPVKFTCDTRFCEQTNDMALLIIKRADPADEMLRFARQKWGNKILCTDIE